MPAPAAPVFSEVATLKADSFGRISLMRDGEGLFVRRDLAHVPLWLRLPAWLSPCMPCVLLCSSLHSGFTDN